MKREVVRGEQQDAGVNSAAPLYVLLGKQL
jgi:hypothetical protein